MPGTNNRTKIICLFFLTVKSRAIAHLDEMKINKKESGNLQYPYLATLPAPRQWRCSPLLEESGGSSKQTLPGTNNRTKIICLFFLTVKSQAGACLVEMKINKKESENPQFPYLASLTALRQWRCSPLLEESGGSSKQTLPGTNNRAKIVFFPNVTVLIESQIILRSKVLHHF